MKTLLNGNVIDAANVPAELPRTRRGAFETLLWLERRPIFWREHLTRFEAGCHWAALGLPASADELLAHVTDLAAMNHVETGVVRIAHWRTNEGRTEWRVDVTPPRPHMAQYPFTAVEGPVIPPASANRAYKHLDRGRWLDALQAARAAGFHETLLVDESRNAIEAGGANIFFVRDGELHTPSLHLGPLPGIMRAQVLAAATRFGFVAHEETYRLADGLRADEVWLTNSLIGIRPIARVGDRPLADRWPVLDAFRAKWRDEFGWDAVVVCK
jgi:branched-subunit amino acid aminotransferase/4-amino-4-deoxychorismate lyase